MKAVIIITSALCLFFPVAVSAQKQLVLKEKVRVPATQRKVVGSFVDNASGAFFRIFEQSLGTKKIEKGPFAGTDLVDKQNGLLLTNGREILLGRSEQIVSISSGQLLTLVPDYNDYTTQLTSYEITEAAVTRAGQLKVHSVEVSPSAMDNGLIILSDVSEGYGTHVQIYSKNFKLITEYRPFPSGFARSFSASNNGSAVCVFENDENVVKMIVINSSGRVTREVTLSEKMRLQTIQSLNNNLLLYGLDKLICVDLNGMLLWGSSITLSNLNIFNGNGDDIYLISGDLLVSKDLRNGTTKWNKRIADLYAASVPPSKAIQVADIKGADDTINVLLAVTGKAAPVAEEVKKYTSWKRKWIWRDWRKGYTCYA